MKPKTVLSLLILSLLLSCAGDDGVVEVKYWNFGGTPNFMEWVRMKVDSFNSTHPGVRVVHSQKSWNMIRELLYTNFTAGTGPDVMCVHANYAAEFGEAGFYYPINRFADFAQVKNWYMPSLFESTRYKDNYYGLPSAAIAFVLVCNKDLFDREGIAPPKTWSEFREAARRLTKDTDGDGATDQYGLVLLGGDKGGFSYRLVPLFLKAGVNILSDDLSRVEFNTPQAVAAVKLLADMYQIDHSITPGFLAYTLSEINDLFCSNKVAMSIEGPWFRSMVDDKNPGKEFYTVPVPVPDDRLSEYDSAPTLQDMVMYSVSANSRHLDIAWELVKYLRNEDADMDWIRLNLGGIATTTRALNSPEADNYPDLAVYRNELRHAKPWPPHPGIISIARNVVAPYSQKAIVGDLTPEAAMAAAAAKAQKILEGSK